MPRETIGHVKCPICGDMAEVRKDKTGKLYYYGRAGMVKPNLPEGQAWLNKAMIPLNQAADVPEEDEGGLFGFNW